MVEEADARAGAAAGALRYAAARMFEDGVGDVAAAMDHLQLALDEPPTATFRPVLRALRLHAVEAGSPWTAIDLLDIEMAAAGTVAAKAELAVLKAGLLENPLGARDRARAVIEEALALVPGHTAALLALEESAIRGGDAALLQSVLDRRLAAAASAGERGRLLCRLALLAEAHPERTAEALDLWSRALDEDAGKGAAALARAGTRRVAARVGKDAPLARAVELEAEAAAGPERAAWLGLAAALARHRLGAAARAVSLIEDARVADPERSGAAVPVGRESPGGRAVDEGAPLPGSPRRSLERSRLGATLVGPGRAPRRAPRGRRRGGGGALSPPAGGARRRSGGAGRAGTHRLADRRRARAGAPGRGGRRSQRATRPSARRWRCAPRSWPRRRRTICRGRRLWPGGRSRPCPATRRRCTCWSGCTRRSVSGASW